MKRILISLICAIMCCTFLCQYVAAATFESVYTIENMQLVKWGYIKDGTFIDEISKVDTTIFTDRIIQFEYPVTISGNYVYVMHLFIAGSWDNLDSYDATAEGTSFLTVEYAVNMEVKSNNENLYLQYITSDGSLALVPYNYAVLSTESNYTYISYNIDNADIDLLADDADFILSLPLGRRLPTTITNTPPIHGSVYNIKFTKEFTATSLDDVNENLQIIIGNQTDIKTVIQELPAQLRDLVVGDPYDKSLDTSDIVAYESDYNKVMEEVDVDQVVSIMDGGISLDQEGMYNEQSFNSVSGFMMDMINATGLMPLITLTLTLGLACFIIGRSGKL